MRPFMELSSAETMREADRRAIEEYHIPSIQLMEAASRAIVEQLRPWLTEAGALIFCGSGNNGGDGVGAAVELLRAGYPVRVLLAGSREHATPDWLEMERRLTELGGRVEDFNPAGSIELQEDAVILDAVFGIGLNREPEGKALDAIRFINLFHDTGYFVAAADIPSGVEADTGRILGQAVCADLTVTFSRGKPGLFVEPGCTCCGTVRTEDIGIPEEVLERSGIGVETVTEEDVFLPRRSPLTHKGNYGKLLLLGGSAGYTGAPTLCARAAVRAGAGLVYLGVPSNIYEITAMKNDEAMPFPLPAAKDGGLTPLGIDAAVERLGDADACAAGPGLGKSKGSAALVEQLLAAESGAEKPIILDADALNVLAGHLEWLKKHPGPVILTPPEGEFLRLGGQLTGDRLGDARRFAQDHGCVLVLKGHRTVAAFPDGTASICTRGNPGMAKGGSGDVLTGILAAMLGQFPGETKQAVRRGLYLHALAGDLCAGLLGEYSMTATDMIAALPRATRDLMEAGDDLDRED